MDTYDQRAPATVVQFNFSQATTTTLQTDPKQQNATVYSDNLMDRPVTLNGALLVPHGDAVYAVSVCAVDGAGQAYLRSESD